jgi:HK97 family phage major capsid protein
MLQKAYSLVQVKGFDPKLRTFSGIATSPVADRVGDTIESAGIKYKNPLPLLLYHDSKKPVGEAKFAKYTADGTPFTALISSIDRPGIVKDRLDEAVDSLSANPPLIRGVSIGFMPLEQPIFNKETQGFHYPSIEVHELSMVVIPAHQDATIATLKSLDTDISAASGASVIPPGVSGSSRVVSTRRTQPMKKSYADMIADCVASRKEKTDKIDALLTKSGDAGLTLDETEAEEHDTLAAQIVQIDKQLERYRAAEAREKAEARQVRPDGGLEVRPGTPISVTDPVKQLGKGIMFARYAMCMGMSRGNPYEAKQLAKDNYGDGTAPILEKMIDFQTKGAVGGANTQTAGWASELVPYTLMDDFIEFLRPGTIVGKFGANGIPALRRVPFNTRVSGFSAGLTANWVGEGLPILLSKATSFTTSLTWAKVAALAVLTKEEIRFSNPSAEAKVRDEIARCMIAKLDKDFIDPAKNASANVSPASITNQTTPILTTGTTAATLRTDLATLIATFAAANMSPEDIVLIMNTTDALNISLMITSLGNPVFPGLTMAGGNLLGFPVITTTALTSIGSPVSNIIVAVKASEVYLADDGVVTVDASDQASVEMVDSSSQTGIVGTGASLVSFWQDGLVGLKATREITWKIRRTGAARYIYNSAYKA